MLTIVFAFHLLAVNVATAGPLVCVWLRWRQTRHGDGTAALVGRKLARHSIVMFSAGMVLGLVLLGLLWIGGRRQFFDLIRDNPWLQWKLWWGLGELVFYLLCTWAYLVLWDRLDRRRLAGRRAGRLAEWGHALLAVLAATNLIYHFPPLFSILSAVSMDPTLRGESGLLDRAAFLHLMASVESLSMVVHFLLASLAVTGVVVMGYSMSLARHGEHAAAADRVARWGGRIALPPTLAQLLAGLYVLFHLPEWARDELLGGELASTGLLAASVAASLGLMHQLAAVSMGDTRRPAVIRSMALITLVVLLMSGTLQRVKDRAAPSNGRREQGRQFERPGELNADRKTAARVGVLVRDREIVVAEGAGEEGFHFSAAGGQRLGRVGGQRAVIDE